MRRKITVVGAGNVGATTAQRLAERDYADVVLVDIVEGMPQGKALDLNQAGPVVGYEPNIVGTNGYDETSGSDIVVITSGLPRKPGMSRDDLLAANRDIVSGVTREVADRSPDCIIICVTNPLDAMCHVTLDVSEFPRQRVVGMAGILDSARFRTFLAWELGVSARDVTGFVLGGHGDTMVPIVSYTNVAGVPVSQKIEASRLEEIVQRTRDGGAEVVKLLKSGSAYYAPSAAVVEMVDSILHDQKRVLPCAALCNGEYGIDGLFVGVPVKIGKDGVEEIIEIELSEAEQADLHRSADAVRELVDAMAALEQS
jgi:malate dehydrogenase